MDHKAFHEAVGEIAKGRYFSTEVQASTHPGSKTTVDWKAYIDGRGWTRDYGTAEEVLAELTGWRIAQTTVEDLGEAPTATPSDTEPPPPPAPIEPDNFATDF